MQPKPLIEVENFRKVYRGHVAVENLSFSVQASQVVGLVGHNGAGKTTTLRSLSGIIPATSGDLSVCGLHIQNESIEAKRNIAFVPDDPRLFDALTVEEHLKWIASAYDMKDWKEDAERWLNRFSLLEKKDALGSELSRGMRQKVAICCAYIRKPKVIFFDEPLTGLDPPGIRTFKETVLELAELGCAMMISSHLLTMVQDLCTHLLIMDEGKKLFFGALKEAYEQYDVHEAGSLENLFFNATES